MNLSLKNIIAPKIHIALLLLGSCVPLWFLADIGNQNPAIPQNYLNFFQLLHIDIPTSSLFYSLITLVFMLINGFVIAQLNSKYSIIRTRTFLPLFVFVALVSSWSSSHYLNQSHVALTLTVTALYFFFNMHRNENGVEQAYMGSFMIGIASVLINSLIFLLPICWIGFVLFQCFSPRTFFSSVFGMITPWILYLSYFHLTNPEVEIIQSLNPDFYFSFTFHELPLHSIVYIISISIVLIIGILGMFASMQSDAIHTRTKLNFLVWILVSITILALIFSNQAISLLPIIALTYSIILSHPLSLKVNSSNAMVFIAFCIINIIHIIFKTSLF